MMPSSLDSSRPILVANARNRASTYSAAPSTTSSITSKDDTGLYNIATGLKRLENARLQEQRYVLNEKKVETISKLALGAKLDRALRRRMSGQDAVWRRRSVPVAVIAKAQ